MKTLPDMLRPGLRAVLIGVNPSPPSVAAGYYFASRSNRFWRAMAGAGFIDASVVPGAAAMRTLFEAQGLGFTDLVKRPTPMASALRAADYREGAQLLQAKLRAARPAVAWFHGKLAWDNYRRYALGERGRSPWGLQETRVAGARVFVTPNPSAANAAYSLDVLTGWYREARELLPATGPASRAAD